MAKRLVYAEDVKTEIDNWLECVGYATIGKGLSYYGELLGCIADAPTVDAVEVVRCKDCIYFQPDFVLTNDRERRPYTEEEKETEFGMVNMTKGINCGSRCERHGYWEENSIPVWFSENDFCTVTILQLQSIHLSMN